ncbi:hypothetical protein HPB50_000202 [Hyalomma asiaticum]|uniref:Uncharacterized protein n=1 Tax=Hyalomma asiaticum TaxID=266040 RepID=A0ACB7TC88_HYAAI|nr:hypothetical protein HPB50_000202 [Hyalomma asiaticum]
MQTEQHNHGKKEQQHLQYRRNLIQQLVGDMRTRATRQGPSAHTGGFCATDESPGTECEAEVIPAGLRDALDSVSFDNYVDVDNSAVVCGTITDDDIIAQVTGGEEPVVEADKNDEQEEAPTRPSSSQLLEAMGVTRLFF